ncbi:hypothetical protein HYC85_009579 [Camellia sinensis]|uniref:PI4-kinase N-terminal domain-containing protein n=1 Tax=Camellia sinensis TaxID=4442 RepID=A0A7J7HG78_CAMSI|nr:hypothetical protein HYC85_009579 [Camellia sinensis]
MEPLIELCDLIAQKPDQFADKLTWMCGRCLQPESLLAGSPRVSRAQLNAVVALARFLSKCPNHTDQRPEYSFGTDSIASFYADFLAYVSKATELSSDFAADVAEFMGDIVMSAVGNETGDLRISRAFLRALSQSFLPIPISDADKLVAYILDHFVSDVPNSFQCSPIIASPQNHVSGSSSSSASRESAMNGYSVAWKSSVDQLVTSIGSVGFNDGGGNAAGYKQLVVTFEGEPVERLEKQEIAFKLIAHILDKVFIDTKLLDQVMIIAKEQLQSMSAFLKIRKNDWNEQGIADTWGNSQGAMFESVLKTSCEIIEFGWSKDQSPVDSFIMGPVFVNEMIMRKSSGRGRGRGRGRSQLVAGMS